MLSVGGTASCSLGVEYQADRSAAHLRLDVLP